MEMCVEGAMKVLQVRLGVIKFSVCKQEGTFGSFSMRKVGGVFGQQQVLGISRKREKHRYPLYLP